LGKTGGREQNDQTIPKKSKRCRIRVQWQSLSFGANYKAAYCLAVCPAGEDVISPFKLDQKGFVSEIVKPLQKKEEAIYVVSRSDAVCWQTVSSQAGQEGRKRITPAVDPRLP